MPYEIVWSDLALADLAHIRAYIGQFNPAAAQRFAARIIAATDSLTRFPEIGRHIGNGRRELAIVPPYLIRYRITGARVEIIRVRHGAQRPTT